MIRGRSTTPAAAEEIDAIVRQPHHRRRLDYVVVGSGGRAHPHARAGLRTADLVLDRPIEQVQLSEHDGLSVDSTSSPIRTGIDEFDSLRQS